MKKCLLLKTCLFVAALFVLLPAAFATKPNVILIMTDDQGYGDLACHGNPQIKTPNIDKLYEQSVRLTQYHVGTTCSPTRAMLMTGMHNDKIGAWHTVMGRSLLRHGLATLPEAFAASGYRTGMVGKWHLGDNYPFRPHDRGFHEAVYHKGGGIGNLQDGWGNDYFDDTYFRNGVPEKFNGYCTDVWFAEAGKFIEKNAGKPFFCYLATNAPHGPYLVPEKYSDPYLTLPDGTPREKNKHAAYFYGMITCIDENVGRLRQQLERLGIADNTILIFTTDNGSSGGHQTYNAGLKGHKGDPYDGGHRVPFFLHWPAGGFAEGRDVASLTAGYDVLPSLIDLCGLKKPDAQFDGISFVPALRGGKIPARTLVTDTQRVEALTKYKDPCVMTDRWRLVNHKELYDIKADPGQQQDLADKFPEVVKQLQGDYENWWTDVSSDADKFDGIILGSDHENPTVLTAHDLHNDGHIWLQKQVENSNKAASSFWAVEVERAGKYRITFSSFPRELNKPISENLGDVNQAFLKVGGIDVSQPVKSSATHATFEVNLKAGDFMLEAGFKGGKHESCSAYYVTVERI